MSNIVLCSHVQSCEASIDRKWLTEWFNNICGEYAAFQSLFQGVWFHPGTSSASCYSNAAFYFNPTQFMMLCLFLVSYILLVINKSRYRPPQAPLWSFVIFVCFACVSSLCTLHYGPQVSQILSVYFDFSENTDLIHSK